MWQNKFLILCSLVLMQPLGAQTNQASPEQAVTPASDAVLFLETEPAGTFFRLNGSLQNRKAPALLNNLAPGEYVLDLWKEGYRSRELKVLLKPGEVRVEKVNLEPLFSPVVFPGEKDVILNGQTVSAASTQFLLPHGRYNLERTERGTEVKPVFPGENAWFLSALGLAVTALGSGAATYLDLNAPWRTDFPLSPPTIGIYSLFLGDLGWFISLSLQKADFEKNVRTLSAPVKFAPAALESLMAQGESELSQGNFDRASALFQSILDYYPESSLAAEALFRIGRIHSLFGRTEQAEMVFTLLLKEYPLSSLWDRTQKALADLAYNQGDWQKAQFHLDRILYLDPLISKEDVQAARDEILTRRGETAE